MTQLQDAVTIRLDSELTRRALLEASRRYGNLDGDGASEANQLVAGLKCRITDFLSDQQAPADFEIDEVRAWVMSRRREWSVETDVAFDVAWRGVHHLVETGCDPDLGWYPRQ